MTASSLMESPFWLTAGWVMLHFLWVGCAIGLVAAIGRWLLVSTSANRRYAFALACFAVLTMAPAVIATYLLQHQPPPASTAARSAAFLSASAEPPRMPDPMVEGAVNALPQPPTLANPLLPGEDQRSISVLATAALYLPWLWLTGAPLVFLIVASGLIGSERLKRQSLLLNAGPVPAQCRQLSASLRVSREVAVGVCERLARPILVGIIRPMILLPPAALTGWSVQQLEMVLLHELAHVRRWDSLVNLLQRAAEALLFFHPVVWWASAWIRLERELCCDQVVIGHTGQPRAYAETLASLALPHFTLPSTTLAMANSNLVTRVRRILDLEDPSMKVSTKVLSTVAALLVATVVVIGLYAQERKRQDTQRADGVEPASVTAENLPEALTDQNPSAPTQQEPVAGTKPDSGIKVKVFQRTLQLDGQVVASEQADLYAVVAGLVEKVNVSIGDPIKKGQVLAEISVPEVQAEWNHAKALMVKTEAEVELAERSAQASDAALAGVKAQVLQAEAEIQSAQSAHTLAKVQADRLSRLRDGGHVEQRVLDEASSKVDMGEAALAAAKAKRQAATAAVEQGEANRAKSRAEMRIARANLDVARADVERAGAQLQYSKVLAPFDGIITRRNINVGSFARAAGRGQADLLFVVARIDPIRVEVPVHVENAGFVSRGTPAVVTIPALKGQEFKAKVARTAGTLDIVTQTFRTEIDLPNSQGKLLPGMHAKVTIMPDR
jgi:beta-lactamase regulating signal transducer with metallopeptidase domain/multidrug resistance efflux pump